MLVAIKSISINIRDKIRLDTARLFTAEYYEKVRIEKNVETSECKEKVIIKEIRTSQKSNVNFLPQASYLDSDFLSGYYALKNKFNFDLNEIVNEHLTTIVQRDKIATRILKKLSYDDIYMLSTLSKDRQIVWIKKSFYENESNYILNLYKNESDIFQLYQACKEIAMIESNPIKVKVPVNFNQKISNAVIVEKDESIAEGFQVLVYGTLYDYSVQRSELA